MKAIAPEKIYIEITPDNKRYYCDVVKEQRTENSDIEYIRIDAFIKKACDWFRTLDDKEPPYTTTEEFIEGFKKAMAI